MRAQGIVHRHSKNRIGIFEGVDCRRLRTGICEGLDCRRLRIGFFEGDLIANGDKTPAGFWLTDASSMS
jgi:hypothetical protein